MTIDLSEVAGPDEDGGIYATYRPTVAGSKIQPHRAILVEPAAMAAVPMPKISSVQTALGPELADGQISDAQLEQVVRAEAAHSIMLPTGFRQGYAIGDGTGVGKTRELLGIILDNFRKGRKRAIIVTKNSDLYHEALSEWKKIGQDPALIRKVKGDASTSKEGDIENIPSDFDGIVFITYSQIGRTGFQEKDLGEKEEGAPRERPIAEPQSVIGKIDKWVRGPAWSGVMVFDEAHAMANASDTKEERFTKAGSKQGKNGLLLQAMFPEARIVYASGTMVTNVSNLAYLTRLGLWGKNTAFPTLEAFISTIAHNGLAAMEVLAREMKGMGVYLARKISFKGVKYARMIYDLRSNPALSQEYDVATNAFRTIYGHIINYVQRNGIKGHDLGQINSAFFGLAQRFFNNFLIGSQMPMVIQAMRKDLEEGKSPVIQLVNTGQAQLDKEIASRSSQKIADPEEEWDVSPKTDLIQYLKKNYPTNLKRTVQDEYGNTRTVDVLDENGNPEQDPIATEARDQLIRDIEGLVFPSSPIDQVLAAFGPEQVAEITSRTKRLEPHQNKKGDTLWRLVSRSKALGNKESEEFQDGKRKILIFSDAGGTGKTYSASLDVKNRSIRRHYVVQPGWRADNALQGLGRTHRTNQAQPPEYILVTTDLPAQLRFVSAIARRLAEMGALTSGTREANAGGLFNSTTDDLEGDLAKNALEVLMRRIETGGKEYYGRPPLTFTEDEFIGQSLLVDTSSETKERKSIAQTLTMSRFLNRMMLMDVDLQSRVFEEFERELNIQIDMAKSEGRLDTGILSLGAERLEVQSSKQIYERGQLKTNHVIAKAVYKITPNLFTSCADIPTDGKTFVKFFRTPSGKPIIIRARQGWYNEILKVDVPIMYHAAAPDAYVNVNPEMLKSASGTLTEITMEECRELWAKRSKEIAGQTRTETTHFITGALLSIWDKLPSDAKIYKDRDATGKAILGAVIPLDKVDEVVAAISGESQVTEKMTHEEALAILNRGDILPLRKGTKVSRKLYRNNYVYSVTGDKKVLATVVANIPGIDIQMAGRDVMYLIMPQNFERVWPELIAALPVNQAQLGTVKSYSENRKEAQELREGVFRSTLTHFTSTIPTAPLYGGRVHDRRELIDTLLKKLDRQRSMKIKSGNRSRTQGEYRPGNRSRTVAQHEDLITEVHELAHDLDDDYDMFKPWDIKGATSPYDIELRAALLANGRTAGHRKMTTLDRAEGFANYLEIWTRNPLGAEQAFPQLTVYVESKLPQEVRDALAEYSVGVRTFAGMDAGEKLMAQRRGIGDAVRKAAPMQRMRDALASVGDTSTFTYNWRDGLTTTLINKVWGVVKAVRFTAKELGRKTVGMEGTKEYRGLPMFRAWEDAELALTNHAGIKDRIDEMLKFGPLDLYNRPLILEGGGIDWLFGYLRKKGTLADLEQDIADVAALGDAQRSRELAGKLLKELNRNVTLINIGARTSPADYNTATAGLTPEEKKLFDVGYSQDQAMIQKTKDQLQFAYTEKTERHLTGAGGGVDSDFGIQEDFLEKVFPSWDKDRQDRAIEGLKRYRKWSEAVLSMLYQGGMISTATLDRILMDNPSYVDWHRVYDDEKTLQLLKNMRGSSRKFESMYGSLLLSTEIASRQIGRMRFYKLFVNMLDQQRNIYENLPGQKGKPFLSSVGFRLPEDASPELRKGAKAIIVDWQETIKLSDGTEQTVQKTETQYWKFQEDIVKGLELWESNGAEDSKAVKFWTMITGAKLMRWGATRSPYFVINQVIKDMMNLGVVSENGNKPWGVFRKIDQEDLTNFHLNGGGQTAHYMNSKINWDRALLDKLQHLSSDGRTLVMTAQDIWHRWEKVVKWSDEVNRMNVYRAAKAKAKAEHPEWDDHDCEVYAAYQTRKMGDWAVSGTLIGQVTKFIPFLSSNIYGKALTVSAGWQNPIGFMARWSIYVLMPTAAEYVLNLLAGNEEDYRRLPAWRRDMFWNLPLAKGWFLSIPKPYELGVLASGVTRWIDHARGNPHAFQGFTGNVAKSILPLSDPTDLVGPAKAIMFELPFNRNIFYDRPIIPQGDFYEAIADRDVSKASNFAQTLQKLTGSAVDARHIDHLIRGFLASTGTLFLDVTDTLTGHPIRGAKVPLTARSLPMSEAPTSATLNEAARRGEIMKPAAVYIRKLGKAYDLAKDPAEKDRIKEKLRKAVDALQAIYDRTPWPAPKKSAKSGGKAGS